MAAFEQAVVAALPAETGKIDWNAAQHFRFSGYSPLEGAAKYIAAKKISPTL